MSDPSLSYFIPHICPLISSLCFHSIPGSEACSHFAVYYKHMALRFRDLKITSLVIARMDITDESPPTHMGLVVGNLPLVIMLSAGSKIPPWTFYSGAKSIIVY